MKRSKIFVIFIFSLTSEGRLRAETQVPSHQTVKYEKTTKIDFSEKSVEGIFMSPDSSAVGGDQNIGFESLLEPRKDFKKELQRSSKAVR